MVSFSGPHCFCWGIYCYPLLRQSFLTQGKVMEVHWSTVHFDSLQAVTCSRRKAAVSCKNETKSLESNEREKPVENIFGDFNFFFVRYVLRHRDYLFCTSWPVEDSCLKNVWPFWGWSYFVELQESWKEDTIKMCLYLYLGLLPVNHSLVHE